MKHRSTFGLIMILLGVILAIYGGISATIFKFQNIDMTDMRLFVENPTPTIITVVGYIVAQIGAIIAKH